MDKYFDTGSITIGENKDTEFISLSKNMDIYDIEKISKTVGHHVEKLTVINDGPDLINVISKIGYRWDKVVLLPDEARLVRNASELRVKTSEDTKYRITEFTLVEKGKYYDEYKSLEAFKRIIEERKKMKDTITTCEWCGMTYPKGGWTYYKITVRNMDIEKLVEEIEKGLKDDDFDIHIICSDCYDHLKECKEC